MATGVSYAHTQPITCSSCGRGFEFAVWLIVDIAERPDLLARIRDGTIHVVVCSHCGAELGYANAPLLVYTPSPPAGRAGEGPPRWGRAEVGAFSSPPAQGTTAAQDREHAVGLVNLLREGLGDEWRDTWVAKGLPNVPRAMLPAVLSDDPEAALRKLAEGVQAELERLRREDRKPSPGWRRQLARRRSLGRRPLPPGRRPKEGSFPYHKKTPSGPICPPKPAKPSLPARPWPTCPRMRAPAP